MWWMAGMTWRAAVPRCAPGSTRSAPRCPPRSRGARTSSCCLIAGEAGEPTRGLAPIPSLLLTGTVHHHLIRERTRTGGLIVESGDARECHHIALLIGYGAAAVNPYLALQTVADMVRRGTLDGVTAKKATGNLVKALGKGLLKIMSKMGVSTVASYTGAQIFEAIGLGQEIISTCFTGTTSRLGGVGFELLAAEAAARHARAFPPRGAGPDHRRLETGGDYQWRRRAIRTCSTPRPSSSCSTRPGAAATRSSRSTPTWSTTSPPALPRPARAAARSRRR